MALKRAGQVTLVAVAFALLCCFASAALNPFLRTSTTDHCYPLDTPAADICFGTRCSHLFNITNGRLNPVPSNKYPQNYPGFGCNVSVWYEYGPSMPQRACLRPICYCKQYYMGGQCFPTQFNSCDRHSCRFNQKTTRRS